MQEHLTENDEELITTLIAISIVSRHLARSLAAKATTSTKSQKEDKRCTRTTD